MVEKRNQSLFRSCHANNVRHKISPILIFAFPSIQASSIHVYSLYTHTHTHTHKHIRVLDAGQPKEISSGTRFSLYHFRFLHAYALGALASKYILNECFEMKCIYGRIRPRTTSHVPKLSRKHSYSQKKCTAARIS